MVTLAIGVPIAVGACGGGGHNKQAAAVKSPAKLVSTSFAASDTINSGRVSLALELRLDGLKQLGGKPISLAVSGPFSRDAGGISTDLAATISAASASAKIDFVRVAKTSYLGIDGTFYELPAGGLEKLMTGGVTGASGIAGIAGVTGVTGVTGLLGASGSSGVTPRLRATVSLGSLGIDPRSWLTGAHMAGQKTVGGVLTDHLAAQIDIANVLNDISKLIGGSAGTGSASTSTSVLELVQSAITTAKVDIYTGVADHIIREFDLHIAFSVPSLAAGVLGGLTGGSLKLDVTLTDVGRPQTITAPAGARPASQLLNGVFALESRFGSLASLVAGIGGGSSFGGLFSSSTSTRTSTSTSETVTPSASTGGSASASG